MNAISLDPKHCYEIIKANDPRFDGVFFVGVSTTGIYCRPVCTVRTPRADRCTFYPNAASAEQAGYRPCLRCRPELAPGNAKVDAVRRLAQQAAARIKAGALTEGNMETLAAEFGLSSRQLRRAIEREYGVSPVALAQTYRLLLAKQLLTDTQLKIIDIAFASGFSSVRRFNDAFQTKYRLNPSALRKQQKNIDATGVVLRLGYRPPLAWLPLVGFLTSRGVSSLEKLEGARYMRTVRLGANTGWIAAHPLAEHHQVLVEISQSLVPALTRLNTKLRLLFDLDANPQIIEEHLKCDSQLCKVVNRTPGLRVPGTLDGFELALRAVLGQQITVKAATTIFGRFVNTFGEKVETPFAGVDRVSPAAEDVANASVENLIKLGLTQKRATTIKSLARAMADKQITLDIGSNAQREAEALLAIPGIGPWTAQYIAMRALADPDGFPGSDLGLMRALDAARPAEVMAQAESWRPWRAYGAVHLWNSLNSGG